MPLAANFINSRAICASAGKLMDYLLTRFARDLKHLMAQLDRLDEFSLASKRAITVPLLKQMLAEEGPPP